MDGQQYLAYQAQPPPHAVQPPPVSVAGQVWPSQGASSQQPFAGGHGPYQLDARSNEQLAYASASQSASAGAFADVYGSQPLSASAGSVAQQMSLGLGSQVEPSLGPSRIRTRRQAAKAQTSRSVSAPGLQTLAPDGTYYTGSMSPPPLSRPQTPNGTATRSAAYSAPPHPNGGHISPGALPTSGLPIHSPTYPSTPVSATSSLASRYSFPHHSRSVSGTTSGPRSASPALSIRSALTSISSASAPSGIASGRMSPSYSITHKQKKTRLTNAQRRDICLYHQKHPTARQEDMALQWQVERSTISKILKAKAKWLASPLEDDNKTARHKPSKFPEIEKEMETWLQELHRGGKASTSLSDQIIRTKAKEIARNQNISEDKFKASSGWVENFKHRHNIRRGVWYGQDYANNDSPLGTPVDDTDATMQDGSGQPGSSEENSVLYESESYQQPPLYPPPLNHDGTPGVPEGMTPNPRSFMTPGYGPIGWKATSPIAAASSAGSPSNAPEFVHPPGLQHPQMSDTPTAPSVQHSPPISESLPTPASQPRHNIGQRHVSAPTIFGVPPEAGDLPSLPSDFADAAAFAQGVATNGLQSISPVSGPNGSASMPNPYAFTAASGSSATLTTPSQSQPALSISLPTATGLSTSTSQPSEPSESSSSHIDGEATPMPGIQDAQKNMAALLRFFDSQPQEAIITTQDREALAQITCKLYASASGVPYQREHHDRQRQPS